MTIVLDTVTPRGGLPGDTVTLEGSGFGIVAGTITFDPLGTPVVATVASWVDDEIVFTVPTLASGQKNRTLDVVVSRADAFDNVTTPFWVPQAPGTSDTLDYQWPSLEEGTPYQDTDDPRKAQAADFNRIMDRAGLPTKVNKFMAALLTTADGQLATATPIAATPRHGSYVAIFVDGVKKRLADGQAQKATSAAYFSNDGGTTARAMEAIRAGDLLYWNGSQGGDELGPLNRIDFDYVV